MIHELRIYHCVPGRLPALHQRFEKATLKLWDKHGIRQVVRRIEAREAITWTERTRGGAFGAWGHWSPGRLDDRCFVHRW